MSLLLAHLSRRLREAYSIGRLRCASSVNCPSTILNNFSSETTGRIATKFHIQPPGPVGKKRCSNGLGHMTNMAAMPIYGKNLKKKLFITSRPLTLKLGTKHRVWEYYQSYSNYDSGLTLTHFTPRSNLVT